VQFCAVYEIAGDEFAIVSVYRWVWPILVRFVFSKRQSNRALT